MEPKVSMKVSEDPQVGIVVTYEMDWDTHMALGTALKFLAIAARVTPEKVAEEEMEALLLIGELATVVVAEKKRIAAELGITL